MPKIENVTSFNNLLTALNYNHLHQSPKSQSYYALNFSSQLHKTI